MWKKPISHKESSEEIRVSDEVKRNWNSNEMKISTILLEGEAGSGKTELARALSANFGLPYTKVTCFADMDKSDVIGAILPVISPEQKFFSGEEEEKILSVLYKSDSLYTAAENLSAESGITQDQAEDKIRNLVKVLEKMPLRDSVEYKFYPSEIVRAFQKGYILEIQEPTVVRDAAVLMALNSALEPDGTINLPTEIIHRHSDFIAVITTNRGYNGCRPLNEALRDRVQHAEKMELPARQVMVERAMAKTGYANQKILTVMAEVIILLDQSARANAIRGVAGMRSYFYWADAVANGADSREALYNKVIYKVTTDPEEIAILEDTLASQGLLDELSSAIQNEPDQEVKKTEFGCNGNPDMG
ncbi:MAG: ATPase [Eubacterium sp.]|nr:ATPase [Eubacterium sp.]